MIEEVPNTMMPTIQHTCPGPRIVESGAYEVQPAAAAPPCKKNQEQTMAIAGGTSQYEIVLSRGKAMSPAPILSGMR